MLHRHGLLFKMLLPKLTEAFKVVETVNYVRGRALNYCNFYGLTIESSFAPIKSSLATSGKDS